MEHFRGLILVLGLSLGFSGVLAVVPTFAPAANEPAGVPDSDASGDEPGPETANSDTPDTDADGPPSVETLLDSLAAAESESEAKALERRIVIAWNHSGSDTVDLLLVRAGSAIKKQDYGLALQYLDTIIESKPEFAEGWNMRATVYYLIDEYDLSLADIQQVLALQPRHFGALSGLGMIFRDLDEPAKALDAFRQVLSVHPYFGSTRESIEKLEPEVEGREI